ncbi:MAG: LamG-like jellyroll fold domain-containing protein [Spirochaetia bacterium]|nr:LamG-like jellyroll fold domain-containing protein [Spirochaetia bacterium]
MKKIVLLMILPAFSLFAVERELVLGGEEWKADKIENIELNKNQAGENSLVIRGGQYSPDSLTELLIHFNDLPLTDSAGNFEVTENKASISTGRKKYGSGAGLFNGEREAVVLDRLESRSIFPGKIYSGDFSIEFWIYGQNFNDSETIFYFDSYTNRDGNLIPQFFKCYFQDRKVVWNISNFFLPADSSQFELMLSGSKRLVPGKWSHHLLRYSSLTGLMEYLVDGIPDASIYANKAERETGEYYPFYSGEKGRIIIGDNFTGLIDELRLKLAWVDDYRLSKFRDYSGVYISQPLDLGHSKSSIFNIETRSFQPSGTDIQYYYSLDDFKKLHAENSPEWKKFTPGFINGEGGRFLRIKAVLYSDGEMNSSPSISWIKIRYDQKTPPPPPQTVRAEAGNGKVRVKWNEIADPDLDGYYVYFGEKPGKYFGSQERSVPSPIDAGKSNEVVIENLENGRIYYFSVVSYYKTASSFGTSIINEGGRFSSETSARPLASNRDIR